ncbi:MAG: hypothetical protein JWM02_2586 [Frankiales bacterium]|nr:hypothetical protein [Frankiales bacterium]
MRVRHLLLLTQVSLVLTGVALAGTAHTTTTAPTRPVAAAVITETVTAVRPVTRGLVAKPQPARKVVAAPAAAPRPHITKVAAVRHVAPRTQTIRRHVQAPRPTQRQLLDQAIARIPGYQPGVITWLLQAKDGYWGTADWYHNVIWISPAVPANRMYDVVIHEWSHIKSVQVYGGDVSLAMQEMNRAFGGDNVTGAERAADCMARVRGATWTHYTDCQNSSWRSAASRLLAGQRL